jgi:hypothetical protein
MSNQEKGTTMRKLSYLMSFCVLVALGSMASAQNSRGLLPALSCRDNGALCIGPDVSDSGGYGSHYIGHDEPSLLFYSGVPGSGNSMVYLVQLPKEPPTPPKQDGTGGIYNFQLHGTFWLGMVMCDDQSAPNPGGSQLAGPNIPCTPDSDSNIFDGTDPSANDYIGKHPGSAYMEMQFYPPGSAGGLGESCDLGKWCSALTIDSLSRNMNTGKNQSQACQEAAGVFAPNEPANFAYITKNGVPLGPPSPLLFNDSTFTPTANTLLYNAGDVLRIVLLDTPNGLQISITDLTSGESGSMTASADNGFAQVLFDPNGTDCDVATHNLPVDFHPMYSTSSEHTRLPWSASHSYGIQFSDEIGHFEYCSSVQYEGGPCTSTAADDPPGPDDNICFSASFLASFGVFFPIGACLDDDLDFDGVPYQNTWPGTFTNPGRDQQLHPRPILFTTPLFINSSTKATENYERIAFEANLPAIEVATDPPCQRLISNPAGPDPGAGCVNPPLGAEFYPLFTTRGGNGSCTWQFGGTNIPGTKETFGGSSTAEFGPLLAVSIPTPTGIRVLYGPFRQILSSNPCPSMGNIATLD